MFPLVQTTALVEQRLVGVFLLVTYVPSLWLFVGGHGDRLVLQNAVQLALPPCSSRANHSTPIPPHARLPAIVKRSSHAGGSPQTRGLGCLLKRRGVRSRGM